MWRQSLYPAGLVSCRTFFSSHFTQYEDLLGLFLRIPVSIGGVSVSTHKPTFAELGVAAEIVDALSEQGITQTFAIQELTLPIALDGRDIIGQARTGMGKTLGFGVPLLDRVFDAADVAELDGTPRALVVVPTRELAQQVGEDLERAARHTPVRVATVYGGRPYEEQIHALDNGVDVVVGTPGRLIDLHQQGPLILDHVAVLVLDEADEMLDLGFFPDIEKLLGALTHQHQTLSIFCDNAGTRAYSRQDFYVTPTPYSGGGSQRIPNSCVHRAGGFPGPQDG